MSGLPVQFFDGGFVDEIKEYAPYEPTQAELAEDQIVSESGWTFNIESTGAVDKHLSFFFESTCLMPSRQSLSRKFGELDMMSLRIFLTIPVIHICRAHMLLTRYRNWPSKFKITVL